MNISGNGTMNFIHACHDNDMSNLTVISLPSTATMMVTSDFCTESTEGQKWWVKLQSTARNLSTEQLNVTNLVNIASAWTGPESNVYVAPNLKVIGFGQSQAPAPDAQARCVSVTLPVMAADRDTALKLKMVPAVKQGSGPPYTFTCMNGPIAAEYRGPFDLDYRAVVTCLEIRDFEGNLYQASGMRDYTIKVKDFPFTCPAETAMVRTQVGAHIADLADRVVTCGELVNSKTKEPLKLSQPVESTKSGGFDSLSLCDDPAVGPRQRVWNPNYIPAGIDLGSEFVQYWCSKFSK
jgi:hypothetical protein